MEECSVLIETTKSAEDKTSRWFDLPIDYELFRDLLGVEAAWLPSRPASASVSAGR